MHKAELLLLEVSSLWNALVDQVLASRQFVAHLMYLSSATSAQAGGFIFILLEKKRKKIGQAAELARADERAKKQKVQKPRSPRFWKFVAGLQA